MFWCKLRICVPLVALMFFLTLVLPFCVPSATSVVYLPEDGDPPVSDDADPDDIAVNSSGDGTDVGDRGVYDFGVEQWNVVQAEEGSRSEEVPASSTGRENAHWLWVVWIWANQLVFNF